MTEELDIVQNTQVLTDQKLHNMGYREGYQSAIEQVNFKVKNIGVQLGFNLINPVSKVEGLKWTNNALGLGEVSSENVCFRCNTGLISRTLDQISIEVQLAEEPSQIRSIFYEALASNKEAAPSTENFHNAQSLKECMSILETGANKLSPI